MSAPPKRRERLFPYWQLQSRIVVTVCLALIAATVAVGFFQTYFFTRYAAPSESVVGMGLEICLIELLVFTPIFVIVAALVTRGIVGPLRRLPRVLRDVGEGDLHTPVRFRKYDRISFVADAAQEMKTELRRRIENCREVTARLRDLSTKLEGGEAVTADSLAALRREVEVLTAELAKFSPPQQS